VTGDPVVELLSTRLLPESFADWRGRLDREQITPVIAITGSRGKTSVIRAVESIFHSAGLRFASWTNRGVEIEGEGQRGELGPWSRTLTRLRAGGLDVALHELDWATLLTVGAPGSTYPIIAVANLCGNSDACLATPETLLARKALGRIKASVCESGKLILNATDLDLSENVSLDSLDRLLVGVSPDAPVLRRHLIQGGDACYINSTQVVARNQGREAPIVDLRELAWIRDGDIPFSVQNALFATAIARSCGILASDIARGLSTYVPRPESMPGSFNVFDVGAATIVIDRPVPSWFLRTSLRAAGNLAAGRLIRIVGPMLNVVTEDLLEVGRLLGRQNGVLVVHGHWEPPRSALLRQGAAANEVPPLIVQATDERLAILQGLEMLRPGDVLLVLAEDPPAAVRLVSGRVGRRPRPSEPAIGVA
jgi:cyanophycin synthetase